MPVQVRAARESDKAAWLPLWKGYCTFYETQVPDTVTESTWKRMLTDPNMGCLVAEEGNSLAGFATYIVHPGTWSVQAVSYLEDLFVSPESRRNGVARSLIESLAAIGRERGWRRIYWQTKLGNAPAHALYQKLARRTDWVRYDLDLAPA